MNMIFYLSTTILSLLANRLKVVYRLDIPCQIVADGKVSRFDSHTVIELISATFLAHLTPLALVELGLRVIGVLARGCQPIEHGGC